MEEKGEILISEIAKEKEKEKESFLPYKEVVRKFRGRLSWHRLRRLLNTERVRGEKRYRKGVRGYPWVWHTNAREVKKYLVSLKTPSEYGRMGGRGKKKVKKEGVIYQAV